ncbi:amidase signature enzyme [Lecanosticta acicola]|uniref:Amidase signature enzyme n=1 Tax=Lecanosticta acicola TaxID=111012 RepID=A0AAI9EA19_9PEZI|nr:amidase signature enzyme [Lecanosticta acicola]
MSVFSVDPRSGGAVTTEVLDEVCKSLGVRIKDEEKEDYRKLLAVFDEGAQELMAMEDYVPQVDLERFPRKDVRQIDMANNTHGAWAWRCSVQDTKPNDGLLAGKTVALKDMISVKDVPMLMGTEFVTGYVPNMDATVTTRILEAGGHITGKAVCENLCHSATSHSSGTGVVENPHAKGYSSGGSSSGSGALVALGEVDMSIGADQGGSVRIPCTNCAIVGLKPTFGLIPYTGCGSNEPTNDHLGPMTRTVLDNALLLQAIAGSDNIDDRSFAAPSPVNIPKYHDSLQTHDGAKSLEGTKIGIIKESLSTPVLDPRVKQCFLNAVSGLEKAGATVDEVSIPIHTQGLNIWTGVSKVGGYLTKVTGYTGRRGYIMHDLNTLFSAALQDQDRWDKAYVASKNIYLNGAYAEKMYPALQAKATNLSRKLRDAYDAALEDYDVLITPTLPYVATSHPVPEASPLEQIKKQVGLVSNTCQFNQTGHPALTLPIGRLTPLEGPAAGSEEVKLPVGMQIVGKWWAEETVYRVGYAWESANDWREM